MFLKQFYNNLQQISNIYRQNVAQTYPIFMMLFNNANMPFVLSPNIVFGASLSDLVDKASLHILKIAKNYFRSRCISVCIHVPGRIHRSCPNTCICIASLPSYNGSYMCMCVQILEEIQRHRIDVYQFPDCDSDEDEEFKKQDQELKVPQTYICHTFFFPNQDIL